MDPSRRSRQRASVDRGTRRDPGRPRSTRSARDGKAKPTRPAARRAASTTGSLRAAAGPRRAPAGLTGRAAVLGLVICSLAFTIALPLKQEFTVHRDVVELQKEQQKAQDRVAALEKKKQQLETPDYLKALARERLHYVMPGETQFIVVNPDTGKEEKPAKQDLGINPTGPWFKKMYETVKNADDGK